MAVPEGMVQPWSYCFASTTVCVVGAEWAISISSLSADPRRRIFRGPMPSVTVSETEGGPQGEEPALRGDPGGDGAVRLRHHGNQVVLIEDVADVQLNVPICAVVPELACIADPRVELQVGWPHVRLSEIRDCLRFAVDLDILWCGVCSWLHVLVSCGTGSRHGWRSGWPRAAIRPRGRRIQTIEMTILRCG